MCAHRIRNPPKLLPSWSFKLDQEQRKRLVVRERD
jgi:hypothetical protein